jgi:hypothetical protein
MIQNTTDYIAINMQDVDTESTEVITREEIMYGILGVIGLISILCAIIVGLIYATKPM